MNENDAVNGYYQQIEAWPRDSRVSLRTYAAGFLLSLAFTALAYRTATHHLHTKEAALISIVLFACVQFAVQAVFFLHLGRGSRQRLAVLGFAAVIVTILVAGSLWIMTSLNNRMMPSVDQMNQYMQGQQGI